MNSYLPYAGTNAIQEAVIGIHFQNNFPPLDIERSRSVADNELKDAFPRSEGIIQTQISIENTEQDRIYIKDAGTSRLTGFHCSKMGANGKPTRVLRLESNLLAVHFMKYDNWSSMLNDSLHYIKTIVPCLSLETNAIQGYSLKYIDRFTFDGPPQNAEASLLLNKTTPYIALHCFDAGPVWHCHSGWFDSFSDSSRILNQLNVDSAIVDNVQTVTIDHNMICQQKIPHRSVESFFSKVDEQSLESSLDYLHQKNHTIMINLLQVYVSRRIGMKP